MGRILEINLTDRTVTTYDTPRHLLETVLGGRGLGVALLQKYVKALCQDRVVQAFDPENPLIFSAGPFTRTGWPAATQFHVTAVSPLTRGLGGGFAWGSFGQSLSRLGLDAIVFTGASERPVYVVLSESGESVRFEGAEDLLGLSSSGVQSTLCGRHGDVSIACTGPAADKRSYLAAIMSEHHAVVRTGLGAVMGSKNLKAIVIPRKSMLAGPSGFKDLEVEMASKVASHPASVRLRQYGKSILVKSKNQVGDLPTRNHQEGSFEHASNLDAEAVAKYTGSLVPCPACPVACIRETVVPSGKYKCRVVGLEYEPIAALGPRIGNGNLELLAYAFFLCQEYGLDPIGVGGVIAFAMECAQRGILDPGDIGAGDGGSGNDFGSIWGNDRVILGLIHAIGKSEGLGRILGRGSLEAAWEVGGGAVYYAMQSKGVELSGQEPRQSKAFGLSLAVSNWGADWGYGLPTIDVAHNEAAAKILMPELLPDVLNVVDQKYKPELVVFSENYNAVCDSLGLCKYSAPETYAVMPSDIARGLSLLFGQEVSVDDVMKAGERIICLERLFNAERGFSRSDDTLPSRFSREPLRVTLFEGDRLKGLRSTGKSVEVVIDLDPMLDRYYELRGWDKNGRPAGVRCPRT
ncbi:MAG TPA: aldehyde ferredoxin oxidoreductase family protein [Clostridia bacterium]|nr:aldehyde ferredoxin oxidoreductase family protein [Clostridia bacterium]